MSLVETGDKGVLCDIDTIEDLENGFLFEEQEITSQRDKHRAGFEPAYIRSAGGRVTTLPPMRRVMFSP